MEIKSSLYPRDTVVVGNYTDTVGKVHVKTRTEGGENFTHVVLTRDEALAFANAVLPQHSAAEPEPEEYTIIKVKDFAALGIGAKVVNYASWLHGSVYERIDADTWRYNDSDRTYKTSDFIVPEAWYIVLDAGAPLETLKVGDFAIDPNIGWGIITDVFKEMDYEDCKVHWVGGNLSGAELGHHRKYMSAYNPESDYRVGDRVVAFHGPYVNKVAYGTVSLVVPFGSPYPFPLIVKFDNDDFVSHLEGCSVAGRWRTFNEVRKVD